LTGLEIQVAAAKIARYATRESGDTLEMIERPRGGLSFVLADGMGHGKPAKLLSNLVAKKAVALLADGIRDGVVARATHDFLFAYRQGQVSATLNIISLDLATRTLVLTANSHCPVVWIDAGGEISLIADVSPPIGLVAHTRPTVRQIPLAPDTALFVITDGILDAGERHSDRLDLIEQIRQLWRETDRTAQSLADGLLAAAVARDRGRPDDDMSVLVIRALTKSDEDATRRLCVHFPIL